MFIPGIHRRANFSPTADTNGGASAPTDPAVAEITDAADIEIADASVADPAAPAAQTDKDKNRDGYEQRKAKQEADALRKELDGYKRREDEARKAKLTDDERLKEERDSLAAENERLKLDRMRDKIAAEMKLPPALAARLIGTDEESMRADAEDIAKLLPKTKVGTAADPVRDNQGVPTYTRAQLRADPDLARKVAADLPAGKCKVVG